MKKPYHGKEEEYPLCDKIDPSTDKSLTGYRCFAIKKKCNIVPDEDRMGKVVGICHNGRDLLLCSYLYHSLV